MQRFLGKKSLPVNTEGRDFVIGDLHGCYSLLDTLLDHVNFNTKTDRLLSVGDLVDRGPSSLKCLRLLNEPWFHSVMGNHEEMMMHWLEYGNPLWAWNGGHWRDSLSERDKNDLVDLIELKVCNLPGIITVDMKNGKKFHVVHAEVFNVNRPGKPLSDDELLGDWGLIKANAREDSDRDITWGRFFYGQLYGYKMRDDPSRDKNNLIYQEKLRKSHPGKFVEISELSTVYCGHTTVGEPVRVESLFNLDTGAYRVANGELGSLTMVEPLTQAIWSNNGHAVYKPVVHNL